jgi:hypothetical protein
MNDHSAKMLSTLAIWIATACVFIFGVFRFNWTGVPSGLLWTIVSLAIASGAAVATQAVWRGDSAPRREGQSGAERRD